MNCQCTWVKDKNDIFINHILQLLSLSDCNKNCLCLLCEISKVINCKCRCGNFQTNLIECEKCKKKLCNECIKLSNSNKCLPCINKKT
jgi:hypothetical protein